MTATKRDTNEPMARTALRIMQLRGESTGRTYLIEHRQREQGATSATLSGTLILEDGSSVAITSEHYAFRWTQYEHEWSLTHPTSEETQPWPRMTGTTPSDRIAAAALTRLSERCEDEIRKRRGMKDRERGDDPVVPEWIITERIRPIAATAYVLLDGGLGQDRLMEQLDVWVEDATDVLAKCVRDEIHLLETEIEAALARPAE